MEFNEKLQTLRKGRGMTQEALAEALFVSRTAISKWESGRGYPNIESLKAMARFFGVTIDDLLSGSDVISIAEEEVRQHGAQQRDIVFGLIDCSFVLLFILPIFGQTLAGEVASCTLFSLTGVQPWLKTLYCMAASGMMLLGLLVLTLQRCKNEAWLKSKTWLSLLFNMAAVLLFIMSRQPYAAAMAFIFLAVKAFMLFKTK